MVEHETLDLFENLQKEQRRASYIKRWSGVPQTLSGYSVAVHCFNCANIYIQLCTLLNMDIETGMLRALLNHDNMELFTGDLLAPAKDKMPEQWELIEQSILKSLLERFNPTKKDHTDYKIGITFPTEDTLQAIVSPLDYHLLKIIDTYEFLLRASEEYEVGNKTEKVIDGLNYGLRSFYDKINELQKTLNENPDVSNWHYEQCIEVLVTTLRRRYNDVGFKFTTY
jgi:5'-deoxynucleotidase YfbR-like HD superfamily hydrolase